MIWSAVDLPAAGVTGVSRNAGGAWAGTAGVSASSAPASVAPVLVLPLNDGAGPACVLPAGMLVLATAVMLAGDGLSACIEPIATKNTMAPVARLAACWRNLWRRPGPMAGGMVSTGVTRCRMFMGFCCRCNDVGMKVFAWTAVDSGVPRGWGELCIAGAQTVLDAFAVAAPVAVSCKQRRSPFKVECSL